MKQPGQSVLIKKLSDVCTSMLHVLRTINASPKNMCLLADLEIFFTIPYIITKLQNELPETITYDTNLQLPLYVMVDELKTYKDFPELVQIERGQGYTLVSLNYREIYSEMVEPT